jgi:hypothetical protein
MADEKSERTKSTQYHAREQTNTAPKSVRFPESETVGLAPGHVYRNTSFPDLKKDLSDQPACWKMGRPHLWRAKRRFWRGWLYGAETRRSAPQTPKSTFRQLNFNERK